MDAILRDRPTPIALENGVDERLARIILKGLDKDPAGRPASMRELGRELASWLEERGELVDATGARLTSAWQSRELEPTLVLPPTWDDSVSTHDRRERTLRPRRWLLAGAAMLIASGSVAWTDTQPRPAERRETPAAPKVSLPEPPPSPAVSAARSATHPSPARPPTSSQEDGPKPPKLAAAPPRNPRSSRLPF
jgi:hypothetical protein